MIPVGNVFKFVEVIMGCVPVLPTNGSNRSPLCKALKQMSMQLGVKHWAWKGDSVKYRSLHFWVRDHKSRPVDGLCERCRKRPFRDLANIHPKKNGFTYTRDPDNWIWLCRSCHLKEYQTTGIPRRDLGKRHIRDWNSRLKWLFGKRNPFMVGLK